MTKGYVGTATKILCDVNLLQFISMVYGNIACYFNYDTEDINNKKVYKYIIF